MSSFTGLYVQRDSTGVIRDVQVIDAAGNENSLDHLYQKSGIQPTIEQLLDSEKYRLDCVRPYSETKERTLISIVGWATLAAVIVALIAATVSVMYDCIASAVWDFFMDCHRHFRPNFAEPRATVTSFELEITSWK